MGVNTQQLKDTLLLTKACLSIRSESDLEEALKWLGKITDCESILVLNFDSHNPAPQLHTNAAFHLSKKQKKCANSDIMQNPLFNVAKMALETQPFSTNLCQPPCGGLGVFLGEKDQITKTATTLLITSKGQNEVSVDQEISQFVLPHIISAIHRYGLTKTQQKVSTPTLSQRELDVLNWVSQGKSNWETARILGISENTVKFHVTNICKKFGVSRRGHAIAKAAQLDLISFTSK